MSDQLHTDEQVDIWSERGIWRCSGCGEPSDPISPEWRWAGDHWQHSHGYPAGHEPARYFAFDAAAKERTT